MHFSFQKLIFFLLGVFIVSLPFFLLPQIVAADTPTCGQGSTDLRCATNFNTCIGMGGDPAYCQNSFPPVNNNFNNQGNTAGANGNTSRVGAPPTTPAGSTELQCNGITSCLAVIMYYIGPLLASKIAYAGAFFFSIVVQLSLNSTAYALDFLSQGWTTVRDVANMAFIFILIYIALTVMLQADTAGTIKTLAVVIVIALLVNFSFFFTRVAIDMGNILALQFYNAIPTGNAVSPTGEKSPLLINGVKDLSATIMGGVGPQVLLSKDAFDRLGGNNGVLSTSAWAALGTFTFIYLAVAAVLWMLFFAFVQVGIKFMLRIVGLWLLLIASPLAFVARTMTDTKGYFDKWLKMLIEFSFYPAIFLFMFLILTKFAANMLSGNTNAAASGSPSLFNAIANTTTSTGDLATAGTVAAVAIRMGFILSLVYVALHVSDWIVKEGSGVAAKMTGGITGRSFGLAAGTLGWGGRKFVGRGFNALSQSPSIAAGASQKGFRGALWRGLERTTKGLGNATYDARNVPGGSLIKKGVDKYIGASVNAGKAATEGYSSQAKAAKEKEEKERKERAAIIRDASNKEAIKNIAENMKSKGTAQQQDEDRARGLNKREIEALKAQDIEKIAHLLTESQLKIVTDSDKYTDAEKENIKKISEPIIKSQKEVSDNLRKASNALRTTAVQSVQTHSTKGAQITLADIGTMHTEVNNQKAALRAQIQQNPNQNHGERNADLAQLHNMTNALNELGKQVAKIQPVGARQGQVHTVI
jgi:hypothetical protein